MRIVRASCVNKTPRVLVQSGKTALMAAARADYWSIVDVIIKHEYLQILRRHVRTSYTARSRSYDVAYDYDTTTTVLRLLFGFHVTCLSLVRGYIRKGVRPAKNLLRSFRLFMCVCRTVACDVCEVAMSVICADLKLIIIILYHYNNLIDGRY